MPFLGSQSFTWPFPHLKYAGAQFLCGISRYVLKFVGSPAYEPYRQLLSTHTEPKCVSERASWIMDYLGELGRMGFSVVRKIRTAKGLSFQPAADVYQASCCSEI